MVKLQPQTLGHLPPQYKFSLNPYPELRFSRCPDCDRPTGQRTLPLFIHIDPSFPILLNITCRYCNRCDTLICHKDLVEHALTLLFEHYDPTVIGNEYLIGGTVERKFWRDNMIHPKPFSEIVHHLHDFVNYEELRMTMRGWFRDDQNPPIWTPPPSDEWIKRR